MFETALFHGSFFEFLSEDNNSKKHLFETVSLNFCSSAKFKEPYSCWKQTCVHGCFFEFLSGQNSKNHLNIVCSCKKGFL